MGRSERSVGLTPEIDPDAVNAARRFAPSLRDSATWDPQSPRDPEYNCFAWAARDSERWWDPPGTADWAYWPHDLPTWETLENYKRLYELEGFQGCDDATLSEGVEKIALFVGPDGAPSHAARQLPTGRWTSKLGKGIDLEHDLDTLDGDPTIGCLAAYMSRPSPGPPPRPPTRIRVITELPPELRSAAP